MHLSARTSLLSLLGIHSKVFVQIEPHIFQAGVDNTVFFYRGSLCHSNCHVQYELLVILIVKIFPDIACFLLCPLIHA